ncbi:hypothetical protein EVAR_89529_1 [Eumeta japonica]|uniref:Uncharacterized protein n=1 Tax=Eumeta variegata TaxID=151549 RepID=A0A4C1Y8K3_EUMVA|nr:hypothetical protein EVAR_89529_1 [Eumeta japonica]
MYTFVRFENSFEDLAYECRQDDTQSDHRSKATGHLSSVRFAEHLTSGQGESEIPGEMSEDVRPRRLVFICIITLCCHILSQSTQSFAPNEGLEPFGHSAVSGLQPLAPIRPHRSEPAA